MATCSLRPCVAGTDRRWLFVLILIREESRVIVVGLNSALLLWPSDFTALRTARHSLVSTEAQRSGGRAKKGQIRLRSTNSRTINCYIGQRLYISWTWPQWYRTSYHQTPEKNSSKRSQLKQPSHRWHWNCNVHRISSTFLHGDHQPCYLLWLPVLGCRGVSASVIVVSLARSLKVAMGNGTYRSCVQTWSLARLPSWSSGYNSSQSFAPLSDIEGQR